MVTGARHRMGEGSGAREVIGRLALSLGALRVILLGLLLGAAFVGWASVVHVVRAAVFQGDDMLVNPSLARAVDLFLADAAFAAVGEEHGQALPLGERLALDVN